MTLDELIAVLQTARTEHSGSTQVKLTMHSRGAIDHRGMIDRVFYGTDPSGPDEKVLLLYSLNAKRYKLKDQT